MKIGRAKIQETCDRGPLKSYDRGCPIFFKQIGRSTIFAMKFPIITMFFLCKLSFRLNREVIK